jgi:hypothetical protein
VEPSSQATARPKEMTSVIAKAQELWLRLVLFKIFHFLDFQDKQEFRIGHDSS